MMADALEGIVDQVRSASSDHPGWSIEGHGSKAFIGHLNPNLMTLPIGAHSGLMDYWPEELVFTARAGTPLNEIEATLASAGQRLIFEPPRVGGKGTLGGAVASGLAGPCAPFSGQIRHALLGVRVLRPDGQVVRFGGEVVKNVAGYDLSRLMIGALGIFGPLLDVSMRVLPQPAWEGFFAREADDEALNALWARRHDIGLAGGGIINGKICLRYQGATANASTILTRLKQLGFTAVDGAAFAALRDLTFAPGTMWRWEGDPKTPLSGRELAVDWLGRLRFYDAYEAIPPEGETWCYAPGLKKEREQLDREPERLALFRRLKHTFDPEGRFNAGRLFQEF